MGAFELDINKVSEISNNLLCSDCGFELVAVTQRLLDRLMFISTWQWDAGAEEGC